MLVRVEQPNDRCSRNAKAVPELKDGQTFASRGSPPNASKCVGGGPADPEDRGGFLNAENCGEGIEGNRFSGFRVRDHQTDGLLRRVGTRGRRPNSTATNHGPARMRGPSRDKSQISASAALGGSPDDARFACKELPRELANPWGHHQHTGAYAISDVIANRHDPH